MDIKQLQQVTIQDIENHKLISDTDLINDLQKLINFPAITNKNNFYGNRFLYHYQFKNILRCKRQDNNKTIYDIYNDDQQWHKLLENTIKRDRKGKTLASNIYECYRINLGSVVMFKATTAKYLYKKYNATHVLDPTAGWGGRMLGAWALNIDYTGIDTNINLRSAYDGMIEFLQKQNDISKLKMVFQNCLDVNFNDIDYDLVLTSPPYINLEMYEHMPLWRSKELFYKEFFIPLFQKCLRNIKRNGYVCFNISPKMYDDAISYGLRPCDIQEDLLQQLGQQMTKKKQDKIYIWKSGSSITSR